jgi:PBP1b-binding outer membrane lipoprotein LpoB
MQYLKLAVVITLLVIFSGCSEGTDSKTQAKPQQDHIWKQQTQAIERAREVESVVSDSAKRRLEETERQTK